MHLGNNITYECISACWVSQSMIHQKDKGFFITSKRPDKSYCQIQS